MLGADIFMRHRPCLVGGNFENFFSARCKGQHLADSHHAATAGNRLFDLAGQLFHVYTKAAQHGHRHPIAFFDKS